MLNSMPALFYGVLANSVILNQLNVHTFKYLMVVIGLSMVPPIIFDVISGDINQR